MAALAEYFLATENVTQRPAALASLEGLLETQHLEIDPWSLSEECYQLLPLRDSQSTLALALKSSSVKETQLIFFNSALPQRYFITETSFFPT